ncbi:MAG: transcription termination/antitermination protein NusG [Lachnospiraceae bacterium]
MGWYVVHTYSGYENIVHDNIVKSVENRNLHDKILNVEVPTQEVTEVTGKKSKKTQRKIFPGYVLIEMDADDNEAWYVVRNTRGVTGFVGPGSKPVPLTYEEVMATLSGTKKATKAEFEVGDTVVVVSGVWVNNSGVVSKIDETKATATIMVEMFDRETPVEISFSDVKKIP